MKFFGLFIGEDFDPFTMTVRAKSVCDAVAQFEWAYGFSHGSNMHLDVYNKDKEKIMTFFPFKVEGYAYACPYGHNPHFCDFSFDEEDEDYWNWDKYWEYDSLKAIVLDTGDGCPYLARGNYKRRQWDEPEWIPLAAECRLPVETKYKFFASEAEAKKWAYEFFGIVTNLEKI